MRNLKQAKTNSIDSNSNLMSQLGSNHIKDGEIEINNIQIVDSLVN